MMMTRTRTIACAVLMSAVGMSAAARGQETAAEALVNPNGATEEQLQRVPQLTPAAITEIIARRPFKSITEVTAILKQQGLTPEQITGVYRKVFIPINLNTATDEEILSIPGIGKRMLHEFKEYRPYKAMGQFRREIGKYVDKQEVARLERYVTL